MSMVTITHSKKMELEEIGVEFIKEDSMWIAKLDNEVIYSYPHLADLIWIVDRYLGGQE